MNIQLTDNQLIITWERTSATVHDEILDRIKRIRGAEFNKAQGCWSLPVAQADRLFLAFPKASYDYDAICAVVDAQERRIAIFGKNLLDMGVKLTVTNGRLIAQGDNVSPLLQSLIDERGADLAAWLQAQNARKAARRRQNAQVDGIAVSSTENVPTNVSSPSDDDLRQAALLASSLRNAAQNQTHKDAMRQRNRRRKVTA